MNELEFRFKPAIFVGNPGHAKHSLPVIVAIDSRHEREFGDKKYIPRSMKNPEWSQSYVYFETGVYGGGARSFYKVFSNN